MDAEVIPSKNSIKKYLVRHHDDVHSDEWHDYRHKCWWKAHLCTKLRKYQAKWGPVMAYLAKAEGGN